MKKLFLILLILFTVVGLSQVHIVKPTTVQYHQMIQPHIIKYDSIYIDTIVFKSMLLRYNMYNDFKNKNWNKIDIVKFKDCLEKSKIIIQEQKADSISKPKIKYEMPAPIPKINNDIKTVMTKPQVIISEPTHVESSSVPLVITPNKATLTYVIQDTMKIDQTYTIDLTLSKDMSQKQLIKIIDGFKNKSLIDTLITITPKMRAVLVDPTGSFKVKRISDSIQNTTLSNLIRWQWQVTPLVEGEKYLTINVDIYIDNISQSINIYDGKTYVYAIHTWYGDLWNWIAKYWTYITYVVGGIVAIFGWLYKEKIISIFKKKES